MVRRENPIVDGVYLKVFYGADITLSKEEIRVIFIKWELRIF